MSLSIGFESMLYFILKSTDNLDASKIHDGDLRYHVCTFEL